MPSTKGLALQPEASGDIFSDLAVEKAMTIERILERANEIRRARGGLFGYDFEDWLQATQELTDERARFQARTETVVLQAPAVRCNLRAAGK